MHYTLAWSGGKDSTASIILAHLHNEPLDTIIFVEVMYDLKNNISGENPRHIDFINNKAKPIFEEWGYHVEILRADRDYLDIFNRIIKKPRIHMEYAGKKQGFPLFGRCGVKRDLKLKPIYDYYKNIHGPITQYIGIGIDEPRRLESLHKEQGRISLLEKYGYTENMARQLCIEYELLSPCYELSKRNGCWFCPNAKMAELKEMRQLYPDVWKQFVELENDSNLAYYSFNPFGQSLHEIEENLKWDEAQMTIWDYEQ